MSIKAQRLISLFHEAQELLQKKNCKIEFKLWSTRTERIDQMENEAKYTFALEENHNEFKSVLQMTNNSEAEKEKVFKLFNIGLELRSEIDSSIMIENLMTLKELGALYSVRERAKIQLEELTTLFEKYAFYYISD